MLRYLVPSLAAALVTVGGAVVAVYFRNPRREFLGLAMGFSAGLLAWVSLFELLPEANQTLGPFRAVAGYAVGFLLFRALEALAPHRHGPRANGDKPFVHSDSGRKVSGEPPADAHAGHDHHKHDGEGMLAHTAFVIAVGVALHNLLEGLAMGASFAVQTELGDTIALGAAIHNLPIGMAVAIPFVGGRASTMRTLGVTALVAATMPLGTYLGLLAAGLPQLLFHLTISVGGGAILGMVATEVLPEARGYQARAAFLGAALGLLLGILMG